MTGGPKTQTPDCKCYLASAFQHKPFPHTDRSLPIQGQLAYPDTPAFWRRFRPLDGESRPLFTHGIAGCYCQILHHRLIPKRGEKNNMESRASVFPSRLLFSPHSGQLVHFAVASRRRSRCSDPHKYDIWEICECVCVLGKREGEPKSPPIR